MFLDSFKKNIISQLVAADDGRILQDPLEPYFRAFTGAFDSDMPFTFHFEARDKPLLLVYDAVPIAARSSHALFVARCERIKAKILPIADFVRELAGAGCLKETPADFKDRPALPPGYENYWRKYRHFYMDVINGLSYVCLAKFTPTQKLYDMWIKFNPDVLAG